MALLLYPVYLIKFWYFDNTRKFIHLYREVISYCVSLFSIPALFHTFFKPVKNEYRKELILFSIAFGMVVKSFLLLVSFGLIAVLLVIGILVLVSYWSFPYLLYQLISL
jgi:hypothetical protein